MLIKLSKLLKEIRTFTTDQLPLSIKQEAEKTIDDNFYNNVEGDLIWKYYPDYPISKLLELVPDNHDLYLHDTDYKVKSLMTNIKKNGIKDPIIIGPNGFEGNHRLYAAIKLRLKTIPVYIYDINNKQ